MRTPRPMLIIFSAACLISCADQGGTSSEDDLMGGGDTTTIDTVSDGLIGVDTGVGPDTTQPVDMALPCPAVQDCGAVCCADGEVCSGGACTPTMCSDGRSPCGAVGNCCDMSQECVLDSCAPLCGTERCGASQTCCAAGEVCDAAAGACVVPCPPQFVCGDECCAAAETCFANVCVLPGSTCVENFECDPGFYCEPTLAACIPVDTLPACTYTPTENFDPQVEWEWNGSTVLPDYHQVMMAPVVANITDDNGDGLIDVNDIPDVVFSTFTGGGYGEGYIRIVSGDDGTEIATFQGSQVAGASSIAVGDIDNDMRPEIVAVGVSYLGLVVFEDDGTVKYTTPGPSLFWGGASLVDLGQDGQVEILAGSHVFDGATGTELWNTAALGCGNGRNLVAAADTDLDALGTLEVVTGQCILDADGNLIARFVDANGNAGPDGFPAIGNFDSDPNPEIVVISAGQLHSYNHDGSHRWTMAGPGGGLGPPTIGNFIDTDDLPEVAVAGASNYIVVDEIAGSGGSVSPIVVFDKPTTDASSNVTGSSIFDFEGDGVAEAVYNDECFIHVYDTRFSATNPQSDKFRLSNTSGTTHEYPIIADVDNDGNAEIIAIRNDYAAGVTTRCTSTWPDFDPNGAGHGIRVFGDRNDNWVATRRIWNQHAYWVTNVTEDGRIPQVERRNIEVLNNFRQNAQNDVFFAPDVTATDLAMDATGCPASAIITATVCNEGAQNIGKDTPVAIYRIVNGQRTLIGVTGTTQVLEPNECDVISYEWLTPPLAEDLEIIAVADDTGDGTGLNNECDETNNETASITAMCMDIN